MIGTDKPNMGTPTVRAHEDRLESAKNPPDPIIANWIYSGTVNAVVALPGGAKTLLASEASTCVAQGTGFGECDTRKAAKVLFIATDAPVDTESRLTAIHPDIAANIYTVTEIERLPEGLPALRAAIEQVNPALVVLDTWDSNRTHSEGGYASQDALTEKIMKGLRKLAEDYKCAVLLTHHATRGDSGRARGPVVFDANCDTIAKVINRNGTVELIFTKNRLGTPGPLAKFCIESVNAPSGKSVPVLRYIGELEEKDIRLQAVLSAINDGANTSRKIAELADVPYGSISNILKRMRKDNLVHQTKVELTSAGRDWLEEYK